MVNLISNAIKFTEEGGVIVNVYFKESQRGNTWHETYPSEQSNIR